MWYRSINNTRGRKPRGTVPPAAFPTIMLLTKVSEDDFCFEAGTGVVGCQLVPGQEGTNVLRLGLFRDDCPFLVL